MASTLFTPIVKAVRQPNRAFRYAVDKSREMLFWENLYAAMREPKTRGPVPHDPAVQAALVRDLLGHGFEVEEMAVDPAAVASFAAAAQYERTFAYGGGGRSPDLPEKILEHYLAATLLGLGPEDVYVDIASHYSPAPAIYRRLYGCEVYRQDLAYPPGVAGNRIGGDAARMPVPDGFATRLALHNSFEHFEGDSDSGFIREAGRILRPGGRLCIVPLFLHGDYAIQTDPGVLPAGGLNFDSDAMVWCARGWRDRHGRFYDVPHLVSRIRDHLGPLRMKIVVVTNEREIHPACYVRFVALFERA